MTAIRIGCVPEHFSAPLLKALEDGTLNQNEVELVICKLGTGDMVKRLVSKELDIAICVTEGLVAGINHNKELALFGTFVESPLRKYNKQLVIICCFDSIIANSIIRVLFII